MRKILIVIMLLASVSLSVAQEKRGGQVLFRGNVQFKNYDNQLVNGPNKLCFGDVNEQNAKEIAEKFAKIKKETDIERQVKDVEDLCEEYHITSLTTYQDKFSFRKNVLLGSIMVFIDPEDIEMLQIPITDEKDNYQLEMKVNRSPDIVVKVDVDKPDFKMASTDDVGNGKARFRIQLDLRSGTVGTDNRMFFQLFAVHCKTEDTLDYCCQVVYEGDEYHKLQTKKMGYNYYKNDPVAKYYSPYIVLDGKNRFCLDTVIVWQKPENMLQEDFRGDYTYIIEDYHHVANITNEYGSCLIGKPFKLLDFTSALQEIPLTQEFYVRPENQVFEKEMKIDLRFERGTATLTNDSANTEKLKDLVEEMKNIRKRLLNLLIVGAASPDGSLKVNQELAKKRADMACRMLEQQGIRGAKSDVIVYTWADVSRALRDKQQNEMADRIDEIAKNGADQQTIGNRISALPGYEQIVVPVLEQLRIMSCRYLYKNEHAMEPVECINAWRENKQDYWDGKIHLSAGDFYNLYKNLEKTEELDSLTIVAYREITADKGYETANAMAPYVCNRMALMQMRNGTPNVETLRPFINFVLGGPKLDHGINKKQTHPSRGEILMNRQQIVNNQAIAYFMEQKTDTATAMAGWLKNCLVESKGCRQLEYLMTLQELHFKKNRTESEIQNYQEARDSVLAMGPEQKAILYTEIEEWGERKNAKKWIKMMDDKNPKKWYLLGILAALNIEEEMGTGPYENVPNYLAYFQNCFDLDNTKRYYRYYLTEKNVNEKLRKKYPYKRVDADNYRKFFSVLKKEMDNRSSVTDATVTNE